MNLPKQKIPAVVEDPKFMILFGKQKCGKTTLLSELEDCLIVDFEEGTDYVEAIKVKINNFSGIVELKTALQEELDKSGKKPYKRIALDTATSLEDILMEYAINLYKQTPMGKNFKGTTLRKLPNGAGYYYEREAYKAIIDLFTRYCDTLILTGHVSDKMVELEGKEMWELEFDLTGKLKRIIGARADAIGYVYRKKNQTIVSFKSGGNTLSEARPKHLSNREIVIAESEGEGENMKINIYWDKIFKE